MAGIYEAPIKKFEDGVAAIRQSVPMQAHDPSVGTANPAGATRSQPVAPRPTPAVASGSPGVAGAAAGFGRAIRGGLAAAGSALGNFVGRSTVRAGMAADAVTALPRAANEVTNNLRLGLTGQPAAPAASAPFASAAAGAVQGVRTAVSPRPATAAQQPAPTTRARPRPQASVPVAAPADFSGVTGSVTRAPAPAAPAPGNNLQAGDVNTFTGSNGVTRAVPGLLASPQPVAPRPNPIVVAPRNNANAAADAASRAQRDISNNAVGASEQIGASFMNGLSPQSEMMRRFEISQSSMRGSPQARRMAGEAILGQLGATTAATTDGAAAANEAALAGADAQNQANEGFADRLLDARKSTAQFADNEATRQSSLTEARIARRPDVTTLADGTLGEVQSDGTFRPITGPDGAAVRGQQSARATGELTEGDRLKSYDARYAAITSDVTATPESRQAALAQLDADPLYAGLRGNSGAATPPAEAIAALKANPAAAAQFDEVFGPGASTKFLGN